MFIKSKGWFHDTGIISCLRRERSKVPYIVRQCLEEIERRGVEEVGIYRVSGVATDIQALKTAFDTSECPSNLCFFNIELCQTYPASQFSCWSLSLCLLSVTDNKDVSVMMSEMDVNAIAGTLKLYFRELPEPLFTDDLYPNFAGGIGASIVFNWKTLLSSEQAWLCEGITMLIMSSALSDSVAKESCMLNLLLSLPEPNLVTFLFLLDHLKR